jgi:hypothetical protein
MKNHDKIDRKQFLTLSLAVAGGAILGCTSGDGGHNTGAAGNGGGGTGGGAGSSAGGTGGGAGSSGQGGSGGSTGGMANCGTSLKVTITNNHGHVLMITVADITADKVKTYSTKGTATHDHFIQLTAADFTALAMGKELRKPSCNDDHEHEYIINCLGTEGQGDPNVAAFCGDATMPANRTCGESATHTCPSTPYPKN